MSSFSPEFLESFEKSAKYPCNLVNPGTFHPNLTSYASRLADQAKLLFCEDGDSSVDVLQLNEWEGGSNFEQCLITGSGSTREILFPPDSAQAASDPPCRYFFIHAPHQHAKLRISKDILLQLLTYYQVMPAFLDFVFPFVRQIEGLDTDCGGSRFRCSQNAGHGVTLLPRLGGSGLGFQQCYSLKSIEPTATAHGAGEWPWLMRQTAVYHAFDLEHGKAAWILLKGSTLMKERITSTVECATQKLRHPLAKGFVLALSTHVVPFQWATEHWKWYLNHMEHEFRKNSRRVLTIEFDRSPSTSNSDSVLEKGAGSDSEKQPEASFSFYDLQESHFIEEKANEAIMALSSNIEVLSALRAQYENLWNNESFPSELRRSCKEQYSDFKDNMAMIMDELEFDLSTMSRIHKLFGERKSLVNDIVTYQNLHENKKQAKEAQASAQKLENLTTMLSESAKNTESETRVVKIGTVMTLFFLPGTFICTLMSTDIIRFTKDDSTSSVRKVYSNDALVLFFALCVPLTVFTLLPLWLWIRWTHHQQKRR